MCQSIKEWDKGVNCFVVQNKEISNFWAMLHAKENLRILLEVVESQENVPEVPNVLLISISSNVYIKILGNYGRLHVIEHDGKTSYGELDQSWNLMGEM